LNRRHAEDAKIDESEGFVFVNCDVTHSIESTTVGGGFKLGRQGGIDATLSQCFTRYEHCIWSRFFLSVGKLMSRDFELRDDGS
jgi:hypothetical protein